MNSVQKGKSRPPPLPPRQSSSTAMASTESDEPPPYELVAHQQRALEKATAPSTRPNPAVVPGLEHNDPRSSSQQSLVPEPGDQSGRRTLLLIYIHGFMGDETSFRSFPAHGKWDHRTFISTLQQQAIVSGLESSSDM